jgi:hypothetical protein
MREERGKDRTINRLPVFLPKRKKGDKKAYTFLGPKATFLFYEYGINRGKWLHRRGDRPGHIKKGKGGILKAYP